MHNFKIGVKYPELLSFLLSLIFYTLCISFLAYKASNVVENAIKYTDDKDAITDVYLSEDFDDSNLAAMAPDLEKDIKEEEKEIKKDELEEEEKTKTTIKEVEPVKEEEKPEIKNLEKKDISDSPNEEKNITKPIKEESKKIEDAVQSSKKSDEKSSAKKTSKKVAANTPKKSDKPKGKSMRTGVYNKFKGGTDKILTRIWSSYRASITDDAMIELSIDKNGKATVKILQLSYNSLFNQKMKDFKVRVENTDFPKPPNGVDFSEKYRMKDLMK